MNRWTGPRALLLGWLLLGCGGVEGDAPTDCTDGKDNDGDGFVDCLDGGCATLPICASLTPPVPSGTGTGGSPTGGVGTGAPTGTTGGSGGSGIYTGYLPDLQLAALVPSPPSVYAYGAITLDYTAVNAGVAYSTATTVAFRWSVDALYDLGDFLLCQDTVPAIPPGGTVYGQVVCYAPGGVPAGAYSVVARVDDSGVVLELNENNNDGAAPITLL